MMVTLGILFLLETTGVRSFHYTWPVLLIVIGVIQVMRHNASTEGHIPRGVYDLFDKLKNTPDGDGSLLDHSLVVYGSTLSDGNEHNHDPLPVLLIGGASGQLKGGRHLKYAAHTPMANLFLSVLDKFGVRQDKFGDSTGRLEI